MRPSHRPNVAAMAPHEPYDLDRKGALRGEVLGRDALPMLRAAWEDLGRRSVEDNVYYAPRYAQALLDTVERNTRIEFAVVWDGPRLLALLPFTTSRLAVALLQPAGRAWQSKYTFSCMPLLDEARAREAAGALLDVLASINQGEWIVRSVNSQGEACQALIPALDRRRAPWCFSNHFPRAILNAGGTFEEHMSLQLSSKRRKGLARNRRRLEELGRVEHECHSFGDGLDRAVSAFLEIEAGGWKGKRGTALACDETTRQFAVKAFTGEQPTSICRADVLTLNGAPIAVSLIALAGSTGFTVKGCYNETYRSYSAGLLLEIEVIRRFLTENWASRLDSATAGSHVIDSLWPERTEVADLLFSLAPRYPELRLSAVRRSAEMLRTLRDGVKRQLNRLRRS